ncbi:MAG: hypothetical protein GY807_07030 [Gammaproteobacteria bacterium]|nr:hypothetical protein [Gammaproteobacteria bacterium]
MLSLVACQPGYAEFALPNSVQIHGFASLGYFNTSENNFFGDTKGNGDVDFWELGINGSWRARPDLQLSLQVVSRKAGKTDDGDPRIDYGFVDYSFLSDLENLWGLRLGRVVNPFGLYNDTRDMPFTRPSILLPQSIYFDANRQFALSGDGGQLYGERRAEFGDIYAQFNVFQPRVDDPDLLNSITSGFGGDLEGDLSWVGRLVYEKDGGKLRLAITAAQLNADIDPKGMVAPIARKFRFEPLVLSAQYNAERWSLTGEYARREANFKDFVLPMQDLKRVGESYYMQFSYRLAARWEAMLRYDVLFWDRDDRDGKKTEAATGGLVPAHSKFAKDFTVGLRWDVAPSFMVRLEYHNVNGTGWLSGLENPGETEQYWDMFALLAAYRF